MVPFSAPEHSDLGAGLGLLPGGDAQASGSIPTEAVSGLSQGGITRGFLQPLMQGDPLVWGVSLWEGVFLLYFSRGFHLFTSLLQWARVYIDRF